MTLNSDHNKHPNVGENEFDLMAIMFEKIKGRNQFIEVPESIGSFRMISRRRSGFSSNGKRGKLSVKELPKISCKKSFGSVIKNDKIKQQIEKTTCFDLT